MPSDQPMTPDAKEAICHNLRAVGYYLWTGLSRPKPNTGLALFHLDLALRKLRRD